MKGGLVGDRDLSAWQAGSRYWHASMKGGLVGDRDASAPRVSMTSARPR